MNNVESDESIGAVQLFGALSKDMSTIVFVEEKPGSNTEQKAT